MSGFLTRSFKLRALSALVLAPVVIAILYYGGYAFWGFLAFGFVVSSYEFFSMTKGYKHRTPVLAFGLLYITFAHIGFYWLHAASHMMAITMMLMVWFSDIGAYIVGKFLKGPKLLPAISPNKTWSGFAGALFFPVLPLVVYAAGLEICKGLGTECFAMFSSPLDYALIVGFGLVFGAACQFGDLVISYLKRQVGVKDTGALIPGHGGILDRIDSLVFVSFVAFFFFLPSVL